MTEAYPLHWPAGRKRNKSTQQARFGDHSRSLTITAVIGELERLGAKSIVISSNLELRNDGLPRASQRRPDDQGVAVYFLYKGKEQCISLDRWSTIEHNLWAIAKSIEALRGLDRWGGGEMVDAAFTGFQALPNYSITPFRYFEGVPINLIREHYLVLCKKLHPDKCGSAAEFSEMQHQYDEMIK